MRVHKPCIDIIPFRINPTIPRLKTCTMYVYIDKVTMLNCGSETWHLNFILFIVDEILNLIRRRLFIVYRLLSTRTDVTDACTVDVVSFSERRRINAIRQAAAAAQRKQHVIHKQTHKPASARPAPTYTNFSISPPRPSPHASSLTTPKTSKWASFDAAVEKLIRC